MKQQDEALAHEIITLLLSGTKISTANKTYNRLAPGRDGRIRTKLSPVGTETGRLSSGEDKWWPEPTTNLQNLPKKVAALDPLYDARQCLVPAPGNVLLEADLSQAEAVITAAYAGDTAKIRRLLQSDEHAKLASIIFECAEGEVDRKKQRPLGKMGNHALNYGSGWKTFMGNVNKDADLTGIAIDAAMAKRIIASWKQLNSRTVAWWNKVMSQARRDGHLTNPFGRKRTFNGPIGLDVIAYLPQSTIADLLNFALVELHAKENGTFKVVHQIHDAVLVECAAPDWYRVARIMKDTMERQVVVEGIEVVVPVDVSVGRDSWGKMQEVSV